MVKPELVDKAEKIFAGSNIRITPQSQRYLGAAVGTHVFIVEYVSQKVQQWVAKISALADLALTQPHAAYAAFVHGFIGKFKYIMRTIDDISVLFEPLEAAIHQKLIPALTGRDVCSPDERKLLSLPARHGGLNIINPVNVANVEFNASKSISAPLTEMIVQQTTPDAFEKPSLQSVKAAVKQQKGEQLENEITEVKEQLSPSLQRAMELASEKGASIWLTALPLQEQGFCLNKQEFKDALCLQYGWQL